MEHLQTDSGCNVNVDNTYDDSMKSESYRQCHVVGRNSDHIPRKRMKTNAGLKHTPSKRVSFDLEAVGVIGCIPYVLGISDAEAINLYRNDIWYTKIDYATFLQDRIDTIRVYQSVNGNMSGLQDFYCITGLENFLQTDQLLRLQYKQKRLISEILLEQLRQKYLIAKNPDTLKDIAQRFTLDAQYEALQRASSTTNIYNNHVVHKVYDRCQYTTQNDQTALNSMVGNRGTNDITRRKIYPVDMISLRQLNAHLLETTKSRNAILSSNFASKQHGPNQVENKGMHPTVIAAMDHALAITHDYQTILDSSKLMTRKTNNFVMQQNEMFDHNKHMNATTSLSCIRRDSLFGNGR